MSSHFSRAFSSMLKDMKKALEASVEEVAEKVRDDAAASTLFKGTGALRRSIRIVRNGDLLRQVLADKPYAGYVEYGNDPGGGYIYPRKRALSFVAGGNRIFARRVKAHPPMPFMRTAAEAMTGPRVESIIRRRLKGIL